MAVKLNDKRREVRTVTVKWGEDDVDVSYHPNVVTPALLDEVDKAAEADNNDALGVLLEPVLDWWDVLDDDGNRLPTDKATIRDVPMRFLVLIQRAIVDDQNPPEPATSLGA